MSTLNMKRLAHLSFIKENYIWSHVMVEREDSSLRQMQRQIFSNFYTEIPKRLNYSSVMEEYLSIACMYQGSFFNSVMNNGTKISAHIQMTLIRWFLCSLAKRAILHLCSGLRSHQENG